MNDSSAYQTGFQIGQIIGIIVFLAFFVGCAALFVISLVKAISTRSKGWIIGACVSAVPLLILIALFVFGLAVGFNQGFRQSRDVAAAKRGEPSPLLTADMTEITGNPFPYKISVPAYNDWKDKLSNPPYDHFLAYNDAYVGVIAENVGVATPESVRDFYQKNITQNSSDYSFSDSHEIIIDSRKWLTYDATATLKGVKIKYRFYLYSDNSRTVQILAWTEPVLFDRYAPVFDRIAKSFQFPTSN